MKLGDIKKMCENLDTMREMVKLQGENGNWDYSDYMLGMYNGMEFMLAIAENRQPVYREKPVNE